MEQEIASQLVRAKRRVWPVLADLPGGDHRTLHPQRIPPKRERVFLQVGRFILVQRGDRPTEHAWRQELRVHGLDKCLRAVMDSVNPKGSLLLTVTIEPGQSPWRRVAYGLDRNRTASDITFAFASGSHECYSLLTSGI